MTAPLSAHFQSRKPSPIRQAQILFASRPDREGLGVINVSIGNVSLPMHPALRARLARLGAEDGPFGDGVLKYSASVGLPETHAAFLKIIASAGCATDGLGCVVTDGGSQAMELMILGVCGPGAERPLLLVDPCYTNYMDIARRCEVRTVSVRRKLRADGLFEAPDLGELEAVVAAEKPAGVVVIPADNPTGQHLPREALVAIAKLCVAHGIWLISDEAYRQLHYTGGAATSVWSLREDEVPGITGSRLSIESASKVWNACGLRIGALVSDSPDFVRQATAEYTANLCANALGQYIFGALAEVSHEDLHAWYAEQRAYYSGLMGEVRDGLLRELPGVVVSRPDAGLYAVVDVRDLAPEGFEASAFVRWCAESGRVAVAEGDFTLLVAPLSGFYNYRPAACPSLSQMRIACVETPEKMRLLPKVFAALFRAYLGG